MRLYIRHKHHQKLLNDLAAKLGSDNPVVGLEHILNIYVQNGSTPQPKSAPTAQPNDPLAGLAQW
jgi:hypothetical protein